MCCLQISTALDSFAKHAKRSDGLQQNCRSCCRSYHAEWKSKNLEKVKLADLIYRKAHRVEARERASEWTRNNKNRKAAADKKYRAANSERLKEAEKIRRELNKEKYAVSKKEYAQNNAKRMQKKRAEVYRANVEKYRAAATAWAKANPAKRRAQHAARKARKIQAQPSWADYLEMQAFYAFARFMSEETKSEWHVDHIVPLRSKWVCGLHCQANLQVLPAELNLQKRNRFVPGVDS